MLLPISSSFVNPSRSLTTGVRATTFPCESTMNTISSIVSKSGSRACRTCLPFFVGNRGRRLAMS